MKVSECLSVLGGDYENVMGRMMNEERVKRFLLMFCEDTSFKDLCAGMETGNYEKAFRSAHTLKGVCANLGLENLRISADAITEALRGNVNNGADALLPQVVEQYNLAVDTINLLEK